jgi:NAD(P)H-hydrate epimerase
MLVLTNELIQTLTAKAAAALDKELMSTGAFSLDQLMELAGLSVSQVGQLPML